MNKGLTKCMKCKKYFKEVRCWESDGYIPKIWYCERCYGRAEELKRVGEVIDEDNCMETDDRHSDGFRNGFITARNIIRERLGIK